MTDVTRILSAIEQGDPSASEQLLPLVYDELWKLAAQKSSGLRLLPVWRSELDRAVDCGSLRTSMPGQAGRYPQGVLANGPHGKRRGARQVERQ